MYYSYLTFNANKIENIEKKAFSIAVHASHHIKKP
jgi:hypothetical protein